MRIEVFNPNATTDKHAWAFESMTYEDAISLLSGLAEIEVIEDKLEPLPPPEGWTGEQYGHRIIRGVVREKLHMWDSASEFFGRDDFGGGLEIPEEDKHYGAFQVRYDFDPSANILRITALEEIGETN